MLISETQARCSGIDIDSKSKRFGGRGSIIFEDDKTIPLRLERALMTCPIRLPTEDELNTMEIHWLTENAPWDPTKVMDGLETSLPVPLGYSNTFGEMDLLDLSLEWEDIDPSLGEDQEAGDRG